MSDQQCGHADVSKKPVHPFDKLGACDGVERSEGLVEQNDLRFRRQRAGQGHSLPLSTGELAGPAGAELLGWQADELQRLGREVVWRCHLP